MLEIQYVTLKEFLSSHYPLPFLYYANLLRNLFDLFETTLTVREILRMKCTLVILQLYIAHRKSK